MQTNLSNYVTVTCTKATETAGIQSVCYHSALQDLKTGPLFMDRSM